MSASQFAERVGTSESSLYRLHQRGSFVAAIGGGKGRGRQRLYAPEQVAQCKQFLKGRVSQPRPPGVLGSAFSHFGDITAEDARKGFQALRAGKKLEDLVLEEGLHPDTVVSLTHAWSRLTGSVFVSAATLAKIATLPLDGPVPIQSEEDLFEVLTIASRDTLCSVCKKHKKIACKNCVTDAVKQAHQKGVEQTQAALAAAATPVKP